MEALGLGWLGDLGKQGLGYLLFCLTLIVIWWQDKRIQALQEQVRDLLKQARDEAASMAETVTKATEVLRERAVVDREEAQANRDLGSVLQGLEKRVEMVSQQARERGEWEAQQARDRAEDIRRAIREALKGRGS